MDSLRFDLGGLFETVDDEREHRGLTWAALSRQVGVAASTIRRFRQAEDAEADGVLALVRWAGVVPEDFVTGSDMGGELLPSSGTGYVRVDMDVIRATTAGRDIPHSRSRTTIQHLVDIAAESGLPIAALTRVSDW